MTHNFVAQPCMNMMIPCDPIIVLHDCQFTLTIHTHQHTYTKYTAQQTSCNTTKTHMKHNKLFMGAIRIMISEHDVFEAAASCDA